MKTVVIQQLLIVCLMTLVATVTGPFGTYLELPTFERAIYWFIAISGIAVMMQLGMRLILTHPALAGFPYVVALLLATAVAALPSSVIMVFTDAFFRGSEPRLWFFGMVWLMIFAVGAVISYAHFPPRWRRAALAEHEENDLPPIPEPAVNGTAASTPIAPFFKRLKPEIGQDLISISVADHYIEVDTKKGRDTLLLRLSDAETELMNYPGLRVHRSHWVALEEVSNFKRHGHTGTVTMSNGREIPVARARVQELTRRLEP